MINIFTHIQNEFTNAQLQNAYFYLKDNMDVDVKNIQEMICHALLCSYGNVDGAISYIVDWVYDAHIDSRPMDYIKTEDFLTDSSTGIAKDKRPNLEIER
tara:strand:- start:244 stop:543 length:300 start_codon:yes stop_codon:yes gene_type:complete